MRGGWLVNPDGVEGGREHAKAGLARWPGRRERARLSVGDRRLLGGRDVLGRREEPPRDESGFRARSSDQRFHRLLRHAVARALTTAPSLAGVSPAAEDILIPHGWRRNRRTARCRTNPATVLSVVTHEQRGKFPGRQITRGRCSMALRWRYTRSASGAVVSRSSARWFVRQRAVRRLRRHL